MTRPGDTFATPAVAVTEQLRADLVRLGGFTHPLFTRPEKVMLPEGSPLPGQAVLLLMGGLVEQSGRLDDAIALLGMREVRFRRPAIPGTRIRVTVEVVSCSPYSPGRAVCEMRWDAADDTGAALAQATVQMLVSDSAASDGAAIDNPACLGTDPEEDANAD
jgi:hypothetical protein